MSLINRKDIEKPPGLILDAPEACVAHQRVYSFSGVSGFIIC